MAAGPVEGKAQEKKCDGEREPSRLMLALLCMVSALEGADTQLLPSAMKALQTDIDFKLTQIAYLTLAQMVCTNLAAPFWGILADRGVLRRKSILMIGALGQGLVTTTLAFSTTLWPMIVLRAVEGAMLAALRPISNGIIADVTSEGRRGRIFGRVQSSLQMGMFLSSIMVVNMANTRILGLQGWRVAFVMVGVLAATVSLTVGLLMTEPPREGAKEAGGEVAAKRGCRAIFEELGELAAFARIPTFLILLVQGTFGNIPWSVMGNMVLYFQLCGLSDFETSVLAAEFTVAGALGNLVAGYVSDTLARHFGMHGRPLNAQISVATGIPLIYMMYSGVPAGQGSFAIYFFIILGFGLLSCWSQSGTNFPILSEIVPASSRSRIMSWECALEHSIANGIGPPVVALLATNLFGYKFGAQERHGTSLHSAEALGRAMNAVICLPWLVCFLAYALLHWSYPRDVRRMQAAQAKQQEHLHVGGCATQASAPTPSNPSPSGSPNTDSEANNTVTEATITCDV